MFKKTFPNIYRGCFFPWNKWRRKKNCHHKLDTRRSSRHYSIVQKQRHSLRELYGSRVPSIVHSWWQPRFERVFRSSSSSANAKVCGTKQQAKPPETDDSVSALGPKETQRSFMFFGRKKSVAKTNCSTTVKWSETSVAIFVFCFVFRDE